MSEFRMFGGSVHSALIHAATQYDVRQARGKRYNHYALAQYFGRIEAVEKDIAAGADVRGALCAAFSGSLLDCLLKAVGEAKHDPAAKFGEVFYRPVAAVAETIELVDWARKQLD